MPYDERQTSPYRSPRALRNARWAFIMAKLVLNLPLFIVIAYAVVNLSSMIWIVILWWVTNFVQGQLREIKAARLPYD